MKNKEEIKQDTYKYNLPQCSVKYLKELVNNPAWADDLFKMRHGGDAYDALPQIDAEPILKKDFTQEELSIYRKDIEKWASVKTSEFILTEKQRKAIRSCLKHFIPKSALPPGKYSNILLKSFDIFDDEEET